MQSTARANAAKITFFIVSSEQSLCLSQISSLYDAKSWVAILVKTGRSKHRENVSTLQSSSFGMRTQDFILGFYPPGRVAPRLGHLQRFDVGLELNSPKSGYRYRPLANHQSLSSLNARNCRSLRLSTGLPGRLRRRPSSGRRIHAIRKLWDLRRCDLVASSL